MAMVILSQSVKKFSVSRIQDLKKIIYFVFLTHRSVQLLRSGIIFIIIIEHLVLRTTCNQANTGFELIALNLNLISTTQVASYS